MTKAFLVNGNLTKVPKGTKEDYTFPSGSEYFSIASQLIPGISAVSGARVLIGDKASLQAVSLTDRQAPLVQSAAEKTGQSFVGYYGDKLATLRATGAGTVTEIEEDHMTVKEGKENKTYQLYNHFLSGRKSYIHHIPRVKVGDKVKEGDILATTNYATKDGDLALGTNLKAAIMPYRSLNFEDAYVITESGAKKMLADQMFSTRFSYHGGVEGGKQKFISLYPRKFTTEQLANIDDEGVIKKGSSVKKGDPIVLAVSPRSLKSLDLYLGNLSKVLKNAYTDKSETWDYEYSGTVTDVVKQGELTTINIKTTRGMETGDKVSVFGGAKGVTAAILPDHMAPTGEDGKPVDIILNSMSITSRVAPGIPIMMAMGKVAEKTGEKINITPFSHGNMAAEAKALLDKHGLKAKEELYDPVTGNHTSVFTGPLYVNRLLHIAEDKVSGRGQGMGYTWDKQPSKMVDDASKRVGNLATNALLSNNMTHVLEDVAVNRGTNHEEFWTRLKLGHPLPPPKVPFVFEKFISRLEGSGIKVAQHEDGRMQLLPSTDADVLGRSNGEILEPLTYKVKKDELHPEKDGLFDPDKTGLLGDKYNHISLPHPIVNPIMEDAVIKLFRYTKVEYRAAMLDGTLKRKLENLDVKAELAKQKQLFKSGPVGQRDKAARSVGFLAMMDKANLKGKDLLIQNIPVIPAAYRPIVVQEGKTFGDNVNDLYRDLMLTSRELKDIDKDVPVEIHKELQEKVYDGVKAVYGLGDPISKRALDKDMKGLLANTLGLRGGVAKESFFQANVVNKPVDLVGRAVLVPDVRLDMDEASIPEDTAWKIFNPFITRKLVMKGIPAMRAREMIDKKDSHARDMMLEEMRERPAIVSRDPSLHKFNLQGFYTKLNPDPKDKTIKLNPVVYKGFNADNDGDQLNVQLPASDEARHEVIHKMLPSKNLFSQRTFLPMFTPSNESALGLYILSSADANKPAIKFRNKDEVRKAWQAGKLKYDDRISVENPD